jgi:hypothetical protein
MPDTPKAVTKIRIRVPRGKSAEEILKSLQITFEPVDVDETAERQFNSNVCCVDVAFVSPVSTVSQK